MTEYQGTVKWYDSNKAFGFISGAPEGDVFIHRSNLPPGRDELVEGQEVLFKTRQAARGPEAFDLVVLRESQLPSRAKTPRGRVSAPRRSTPSESGPPRGLIVGTVISIDRERRFLFVRPEREEGEIFVHGSLASRLRLELERGDRVRVTVEQGPKGLRASTLELAQ